VAGGPAVEVPGSLGAEMPVFAPDGSSVATLLIRLHPRARGAHAGGRVEQSSIWLLSLDGIAPRRLTPWRHIYKETPWSFEPDERGLGIIRSVSNGRHKASGEAVALPLDGGAEERIATKALGLAFSPDGTRVALLRPGRTGKDLWVGAADGTGLRLISDGPRTEESPTWDPSGQRLAFVMAPAPTFHPNFGFYGNALLQVNADGTCQTVLRSESSSYAILSPSWQPGPGRGAGPISC
jgi:Tol biopolymer transport system component